MTETRKRLVVIDGKSVFYRGYYAMPGLSTSEGVPTGGVYGFAVMALEVIKRLKPDYACVAWDKPKTNIRKRLEIYPEYKAGRKPAPPDFYTQIPILHELLEAFNWPLYELDDYEADDIMATLAKRAAQEGIETVLVGSDLDMLQCVSPLTRIYVLKKGLSNIEEFDPESFEQKYGIKPEQYLDLKALKGDSSDNIPGVPGIGEKTAVELLDKYTTLDGIYENTWQLSGVVAKKLEAGKDLAHLSKRLAELMTNAPVPLDLKHMDMANLDMRAVEDVLRRLEFRSLLRQLPDVMRNGTASPALANAEPLDIPEEQGTIDDEPHTQVVMHARYDDPQKTILADLVIVSDGKAVIVAREHLPTKAGAIRGFCRDALVVGYDLKSLHKHLALHDVHLDFHRVFDVQIAAFLYNSLTRDQSVAGLAREYLEIELEAEDTDANTRLLHECAAISRLHTVLEQELTKDDYAKLAALFHSVEQPVIPILAGMEERGIRLDVEYLKRMSENLEGQISDIEQTIYGYADHEFNISSPQQLSEVLFDKLGLPTINQKRGKSGSFSTAADVLDKLRGAHPIIDYISQYREYTKLKNTYVDPLPSMVDEHGKLHTTFNLTVAQTGRLSSSDPNLQNIPVRTELGRSIREAFVADEGYELVSADYSQFELRLAAVLAKDTDMIEAFNSGMDIHTLTASQVFGVALEDVTKEMRYQAKTVNFGILYGQTPHGLASGTGMSFEEAKEFIDRYFAQRQPLLDFIANVRQQAMEQGYVETLFGRRRPTPDVRSSNYLIREAAFRQAVNMPVQGTEADLMKMAMIELDHVFTKEFAGKPEAEKPAQILQIHDSILIECRQEDSRKAGELMKEVMENIHPEIGIKLQVDVKSGHTWGEL